MNDAERRIESGQRAAGVLQAFDDPRVIEAHDVAAVALHAYGGCLIERGVPNRQALDQMISCAVSAWWRGAVE